MILTFNQISTDLYNCQLDLDALYQDPLLVTKFDSKWDEFLASDPFNPKLFIRSGSTIFYPHKSWVPQATDARTPVLIMGGNPAPHSAYNGIYYSYEGKGTEHRFWKVLRELGYLNLHGDDPQLKHKFLTLDYSSPFRFGMEAIFSFPSAASVPKWSGVIGLERLFGRKYLYRIFEIEKQRVQKTISQFLQPDGAIIAMQKDASNAVAGNSYSLALAATGQLTSQQSSYKVYGTPPTRWLHTNKMKNVLSNIKQQISNG